MICIVTCTSRTRSAAPLRSESKLYIGSSQIYRAILSKRLLGYPIGQEAYSFHHRRPILPKILDHFLLRRATSLRRVYQGVEDDSKGFNPRGIDLTRAMKVELFTSINLDTATRRRTFAFAILSTSACDTLSRWSSSTPAVMHAFNTQ